MSKTQAATIDALRFVRNPITLTLNGLQSFVAILKALETCHPPAATQKPPGMSKCRWQCVFLKKSSLRLIIRIWSHMPPSASCRPQNSNYSQKAAEHRNPNILRFSYPFAYLLLFGEAPVFLNAT